MTHSNASNHPPAEYGRGEVLDSRTSIQTRDQLHAKCALVLEKLEGAWRTKLVEVKPQIAEIKDGFDRLYRGPKVSRAGVMGCRSFGEFCDKMRTPYSTVMAMLKDYERKRKGKRTTVKRARPRHMAKPEEVRLRGIGPLVIALTDAEGRQDKVAEADAIDRLKAWVHADRKIFETGGGGAPQEVLDLRREMLHTDKLVERLLAQLERLDEERTLPADVVKTMGLLRERVLLDKARLGFGLDNDEKKAARPAPLQLMPQPDQESGAAS